MHLWFLRLSSLLWLSSTKTFTFFYLGFFLLFSVLLLVTAYTSVFDRLGCCVFASQIANKGKKNCFFLTEFVKQRIIQAYKELNATQSHEIEQTNTTTKKRNRKRNKELFFSFLYDNIHKNKPWPKVKIEIW